MANDLGYYNPQFYAQEALIQLEKALGMSGRLYRGFDEERRAFNRGDTINIKKPSTFTAQDAPSSAQDVDTDGVQITLNRWKEVKFSLTDKELAFTGEKIIEDHIRPAAYALADEVDQWACDLANQCPWYYDLNASPGSVVGDFTGPRKILFDNRVPLGDDSMIHYMVDSTMEQYMLGNTQFTTYNGAGQTAVNQMQRGNIKQAYGMNFFANQNVKSHTAGTLSATNPLVNGATAAGATSIIMDAGTLTGTLTVGDTFVIAGNTQRYNVTALATASANAITVSFSPPLAAAAADNAQITVRLDTHTSNLAFHRNYAAIAFAKLPDTGARVGGAQMASIQDPISGLAIRSRIFYVGDTSKVYVALDILYGGRVLDPNLAVRACG